MSFSISTKCPFNDNKTCFLQDCRGCDARLEALMHIRDELDDIRAGQNIKECWKSQQSGAE